MNTEILKNLHETLDNAHKECKEEGFALFDEKARENARQILYSVCKKFPEYEYDIYPTEDREIAINCNIKKGSGVLILCDSKGSIVYFVIFDGQKSRFRCDSDKIQIFTNALCKEFEKFRKKP